MSAKPARISSYLGHIHEAIGRIEAYIHGVTLDEFVSNRLVQDADIRNLEIIGEASRNILKIEPRFEQDHPDIELSSAYQMRNALAHGYFSVDIAMVWRTVTNDLPKLKIAIATIQR
ncbi:HepT-like ribonuclease domain-containing protein [Rhizobium sp. C4]|uniref:HepT-like ribonuclease domain-containing protein n=1 Tax=Rhizobium sp. C4 TaxID=1349800 RepID=UPI001E5843D6|nr:DUF86 domain-containing protein [Rhizobium sp. C4]MCD2172994.1 DUF86 domain-containing protein [Rhizobium sp. C4]